MYTVSQFVVVYNAPICSGRKSWDKFRPSNEINIDMDWCFIYTPRTIIIWNSSSAIAHAWTEALLYILIGNEFEYGLDPVITSTTVTTRTCTARTGRARTGTARAGTTRTGTKRNNTMRTGTTRTGKVRTVVARTGTTRTGTARTGTARAGTARTVTARERSSIWINHRSTWSEQPESWFCCLQG